MKLLVLGGTLFLGRHIVKTALKRGHDVTTFTRRKTNPDLFPDAKMLHGDRNGDLSVLKDGHWEFVIDTSAYFPKSVEKACKILRGKVDHYTVISSISVYGDFINRKIDEETPVVKLKEENPTEITGENYGPLKALCEEKVKEYFPNNHFIVRPGLIVGPYDPTDRFTYWPVRVKKGGRVLSPGIPQRKIQFIDVRNLSKWILNSLEEKRTGTFNADGDPVTMGRFLNTCRDLINKNCELIWITDDLMEKYNVAPWTEMVLYIPGGDQNVSNEKAKKAGLKLRPFEETINDTIRWAEDKKVEDLRYGISAEKESFIIEKIIE